MKNLDDDDMRVLGHWAGNGYTREHTLQRKLGTRWYYRTLLAEWIMRKRIGRAFKWIRAVQRIQNWHGLALLRQRIRFDDLPGRGALFANKKMILSWYDLGNGTATHDYDYDYDCDYHDSTWTRQTDMVSATFLLQVRPITHGIGRTHFGRNRFRKLGSKTGGDDGSHS